MFNINNAFKEYLNSDAKKYYLIEHIYHENNLRYSELLTNEKIVENSLEITDSLSESKTLKFGIADKSSLSVTIKTSHTPTIGEKIYVFLAKEDLQEIDTSEENIKYITLGCFNIENYSVQGTGLYTIVGYSESIKDVLSGFEEWKYNQPVQNSTFFYQQLHATMICSGGFSSTGTIGWYTGTIPFSEYTIGFNSTNVPEPYQAGVKGYILRYYELNLRDYADQSCYNNFIEMDIESSSRSSILPVALRKYKEICNLRGIIPQEKPFNAYVYHEIRKTYNKYESRYILNDSEMFYPCGGAEFYGQIETYSLRIPFEFQEIEEVSNTPTGYTVLNTYNLLSGVNLESSVHNDTINEITGSMIVTLYKNTEADFDMSISGISHPEKYYLSNVEFDMLKFVDAYYELSCAYGVIESKYPDGSVLKIKRFDSTNQVDYCNWGGVYPSNTKKMYVPSINQNRVRSNEIIDTSKAKGFSSIYYEYFDQWSYNGRDLYTFNYAGRKTINNNGGAEYDLKDNYIFNTYPMDTEDIRRIIDEFAIYLAKVKYTKCNAECKNNMFVQPGDRILIGASNNKWFDTYVFKRIINGDRVVWSLIS